MDTTETATQNHRADGATTHTAEPTEPTSPLAAVAASVVTLEQALREHVPSWAHWKSFTICDAHSAIQSLQSFLGAHVIVVDSDGKELDVDTPVGRIARWTTAAGQWGIGFSAADDSGRYKFQVTGPDDFKWGTVGNETATAEEVITRLTALGVFPRTT